MHSRGTSRAGESGGWFAGFFGNLYGMQGCNHTNLLFLCDVTEPKTGQTQFHPLYSPTNRYIKIYNKFNKFICNLFFKNLAKFIRAFGAE